MNNIKCVICFETFLENNCEGSEFKLLELFCECMDLEKECFHSERIFCPRCALILVELKNLNAQIEKLEEQASQITAGIAVKIVESWKNGGKKYNDRIEEIGNSEDIKNARELIYRRYDVKVGVEKPGSEIVLEEESVLYPLVKIETEGWEDDAVPEVEKDPLALDMNTTDSSTVVANEEAGDCSGNGRSLSTLRKRKKPNGGGTEGVGKEGLQKKRITGKKLNSPTNVNEVGHENFLYMDKYAYRKINGKFQCGSCGRFFIKTETVARHIRSHHMGDKDPSKNNFRFLKVGPQKFIYGNKYAVTEEESRFRCCLCKRLYDGKWNVVDHIRRKHMKLAEIGSSVSDSPGVLEHNSDGECGGDSTTKKAEVAAFRVFDSALAKFDKPESEKEGEEEGSDSRNETKRIVQVAPDKYIYGGQYQFGFDGELYRCETCGRTKLSWDRMLVHVRRIHFRRGKEKQREHLHVEEISPNTFIYGNEVTVIRAGDVFKCGSCEYATEGKYNMYFHIRTKHLKVHGESICEFCGKTCTTRKAYMMHRRVHTRKTGQEYPCNACGKVFGAELHMQNHAKIHEGDSAKKLQCEFCGKKFFTSTKLNGHVALHTGEKNYSCPYCNAKFISYNNMSAHRKRCREEHGSMEISQPGPCLVHESEIELFNVQR